VCEHRRLFEVYQGYELLAVVMVIVMVKVMVVVMVMMGC
jgi:hypothetical protein